MTPAQFLLAHLRWFLLALGVLFALVWLYNFITANPKAEAKLSKNQAEAGLQSGKDAVNTVGAAAGREAASDTLTRENTDDIRNADGASAPVVGAVRDAGLDSLCKRRAYSRDPRCVQRLDP